MNLPKIGSDVYVPTSCFCFIQHPEKDVAGGLAKVTGAEESTNLISLQEIPDLKFNWLAIAGEQEKLRLEFGNQRASQNPQSGP